VKLQSRAEALNAHELHDLQRGQHPGGQPGSDAGELRRADEPDSSTVIRPRDIQLGAKITF
jgi:hypothetical protein